MALFDNSKKVAELESQLAAKAGEIEKLTAQLADLTGKNTTLAAESAKQFERAEAAEKSLCEANVKFAELEKQLAAEKEAHEKTKASVTVTASTRAAEILQSVGQPPVATAAAAAQNSLLEKVKAANPGKDRYKMLVENYDALARLNNLN
jgi:chromosome segregation ATPase